jgi:hypothetical protein
MANRIGIPQEVEHRLRQKFTVCAYCRRELQEHAGVMGCPTDKATIEHLNWDGPFHWWQGLKEEDLVICCGSCKSSRGQKTLAAWFASPYCVQRGITANTVTDEVKQYLKRQALGTGILQPAPTNPDWETIAKNWEAGGNVHELSRELGITWDKLYAALRERGYLASPEERKAKDKRRRELN